MEEPRDDWADVVPLSYRFALTALALAPQRALAVLRSSELNRQERLHANRRERIECLRALHEEMSRAARSKAALWLKSLWIDRTPFVLHLRSYASGLRALGTVGSHDPDETMVVSCMRPDDMALHRKLERVFTGWPIVKVSNPIERVRTESEVRYHHAEWTTRVAALVRAAAVIVVDLSEMTDGVVQEIRFIRSSGRQGRTILVTGALDPLPSLAGMVEASGKWTRVSKPASNKLELGDFSCVVERRDGALEERLWQYREAIVHSRVNREFSDEPPVSTLPLIDPRDEHDLVNLAYDAYVRSRDLRERGEFVGAEAYCHRTLAFLLSVFDRRRLAPAYMALGELYFEDGRDIELANECFEHALAMYRELHLIELSINALQALAATAFSSEPRRVESARQWVGEASLLLGQHGEPSQVFGVYSVLEGIEIVGGDMIAAAHARQTALVAYGEARAAGMKPPSSRSQFIAAMSTAFEGWPPDARSQFLEQYEGLSELPALRHHLGECLAGRLDRETFLRGMAQSLDVRWELERFIVRWETLSAAPSG